MIDLYACSDLGEPVRLRLSDGDFRPVRIDYETPYRVGNGRLIREHFRVSRNEIFDVPAMAKKKNTVPEFEPWRAELAEDCDRPDCPGPSSLGCTHCRQANCGKPELDEDPLHEHRRLLEWQINLRLENPHKRHAPQKVAWAVGLLSLPGMSRTLPFAYQWAKSFCEWLAFLPSNMRDATIAAADTSEINWVNRARLLSYLRRLNPRIEFRLPSSWMVGSKNAEQRRDSQQAIFPRVPSNRHRA